MKACAIRSDQMPVIVECQDRETELHTTTNFKQLPLQAERVFPLITGPGTTLLPLTASGPLTAAASHPDTGVQAGSGGLR
jgi:hypothetical protein